MDWRRFTYWDLPGIRAGMLKIAEKISGAPVNILIVPQTSSADFAASMEKVIREETPRAVISIDTRDLEADVSVLAAAAGLPLSAGYSTSSFVTEADGKDLAFVIYGLSPEQWHGWSRLIRSIARETVGMATEMAPLVLAMVCPDVPLSHAKAPGAPAPMVWSGKIRRSDARLYAEKLLSWAPDGSLMDDMAVASLVEVCGWNVDLAARFAEIDPLAILKPIEHLENWKDEVANKPLSFSSGLVDWFDERPFVDPRAVVGRGDMMTISRRVWRAQSYVLMPFFDEVRRRFAAAHWEYLVSYLGANETMENRSPIYDPNLLEFRNLKLILEDRISQIEKQCLSLCNWVRSSIAHLKNHDPDKIKEMEECWARAKAYLPDEIVGWEWPRCGQCLTILIGGPGSGKSSYASAHFPPADIISSDAIREELANSRQIHQSRHVFAVLRRRVANRLSQGLNAVIDATNIRQDERILNARLAPSDIPVRYVMIDRSIEERAAVRPNIPEETLQAYEAALLKEIPNIESGDGLPNVTFTRVSNLSVRVR